MTSPTVPAIHLEPTRFRECFDVGSMAVRHDLVGHRLLSLDAIAALAGAYPPELVEHNVGRSRDPEHNFLLQVRGSKRFTTGRFPDAEAKHRSLERVYRAHGRNSELAAVEPITYSLGPGDGVYLPTDALHMVENGPEVSISFSVTWRPREVVRLGRVYELNGWMREHGRSPRPPGRSTLVDRCKSALVWVRLASRRLASRRLVPGRLRRR